MAEGQKQSTGGLSITGPISGAVNAISGLMGTIGNLVNGPKKQYKYEKKLMQDQAAINEEAAQANQKRAIDLYDHQFSSQTQYQDAKIAQQNDYNSASAQRARAEAAGMSKASLGSMSPTAAAQTASPGASSAGAGEAAGSGLGSVDVAGHGAALGQATSAMQKGLVDVLQYASQNNLRLSQQQVNESQSTLNKIKGVTESASAALIGTQTVGQDTQNKIAAVQLEIMDDTKDVSKSQATANLAHTLASVASIYESVRGETMRNNVFEKYGMKQAEAYLQDMIAAASVKWAQRVDLFAHANFLRANADFIHQQYIGQAMNNEILRQSAEFIIKANTMKPQEIEAHIKEMDAQARKLGAQAHGIYEQIKLETRNLDLKEKAITHQVILGYLNWTARAAEVVGEFLD